MDSLLSRPFKGFLRDPESIRKLVGSAIGLVALAVALLNIISLLRIGVTDPWEIALRRGVLILFGFSALSFSTVVWNSKTAEWIQVIVFLINALLTASDSRGGDLTSALSLIFGLILALEYDLGRRSLLACGLFALIVYPITLARGYGLHSQAFVSQTASALLGLLFFVTLYGAIMLRHNVRHQDEAEHLESKVHERTMELESLLSERVAMLNEIHHRVKNNLQLVSSLLRLGAERSEGGDARGPLDAGVRRIEAIALVHDSLYDNEHLDIIDLGNYAQRLLANISEESGFRFEFVEEGQVRAALDIAVPFGLLLHELATNAQRHAFPSGGGSARISLATKGDLIELRVQDEGIGFGGVEGEAPAGAIGLELVRALVSQLRGLLQRLPGPGTSWFLSFPCERAPRAPKLPALGGGVEAVK